MDQIKLALAAVLILALSTAALAVFSLYQLFEVQNVDH